MITITAQAAAKLAEILKQNEDPAARLRLFVAKGGCHGYTYGMAFDAEPRQDDRVISQHGVQVVVDPVSSRFLAGARIDYVASVAGEGFAVHNPNAVETCGCGHSFQTGDGGGEPDPCEDAASGPRREP